MANKLGTKYALRLTLALAALGGLAALGASHDAFAAPPTKVEVCHVNGSSTPGGVVNVTVFRDLSWVSDKTNTVSTTWHFGRVISVSESAAAMHVSDGDSISFSVADAGFKEEIDIAYDQDDRVTVGTTGVGTTTVTSMFTDADPGNANCAWVESSTTTTYP